MKGKLSIVIPILNEEKNIIPLTKKIIQNLKKIKYEIIFVDDSSIDNSQIKLKALKKKLFGIKTRGPMAPEINIQGARPAEDVYDRLITNKLYDLDLI